MEPEIVAPPMVTFTVNGKPAPQGSKTKTRWGVREDNPDTKPWRAEVRDKAVEAMAGRALIEVPVAVTAKFYFVRPQAHFRTGKHSGELKPSASPFCIGRVDLDKLQRNLGDALSGTVLRDDNRIVNWNTWKLYGEPTRMEVTITAIGSSPLQAPEGAET